MLEVPYWAWHEQLDAVREQLKSDAEEYALVWPLLRDQLHLCHALISRDAFTITSILPLVNAFPTFAEAPRRIYMSATIADDSEIIRTFDASPESVEKALTSRGCNRARSRFCPPWAGWRRVRLVLEKGRPRDQTG